MNAYERHLLFDAIVRLTATISYAQKSAVHVSRWIEDADPDFVWEAEHGYRSTAIERGDWHHLKALLSKQAKHYTDAQIDLRGRTTALLAELVGLNAAEAKILNILRFTSEHDGIGGLLDLMTDRLMMDRDKAISIVADVDLGDVQHALSQSSPLVSSGIIDTSIFGRRGRLNLDLATSVERVIGAGCSSLDEIRQELFPETGDARCEFSDFAHVAPQSDLALRLLKAAVIKRKPGINILLYGKPGTGKTEFCKALAATAGFNLLSIGETDDSGEAPSARERTNSLKLAQRLMRQRGNNVLLFDELEDILDLSIGSLLTGTATGSSKVFLHRLLETNSVPVLWTVNDIGMCDPALLRRMTLSIEFKTPGPKVREKIWNKLATENNVELSARTISSLAEKANIPPALIAGSLSVGQLTQSPETDVPLVVEATHKAIRGGRLQASIENHCSGFNPRLIETDLDLTSLIGSIRQGIVPSNTSFLFDGPSGSGKSALANHLAREMGLNVIRKRASDLLSRYVGGSEQAIARAFQQADDEEAFLIFDEADSLLSDRAKANANWEVSQVNEMLTWMERHPLPFACTTNLPGMLDPATRRRFTIHATLKPLIGKKLVSAFEHIFCSKPPAEVQSMIGLTPGDMMLVKKRCAALNNTSSSFIVEELQKEVEAKGQAQRPIGFLANARNQKETEAA